MTKGPSPAQNNPHLFLPDGRIHFVGPEPADIPGHSFADRLHYAMTHQVPATGPVPISQDRISEDEAGEPIPIAECVEVDEVLLATLGIRGLVGENWHDYADQRKYDIRFDTYLKDRSDELFSHLTSEEREAAENEFKAHEIALREARREAARGLGFTTDRERQAVDFHREVARSVKERLGTDPASEPYSPIADFHMTQRATMDEINDAKINDYGAFLAKDAKSPRARTLLQEQASLRQNKRFNAIIRLGHMRERYIGLYGDILDDKEALEQELASGRYSRKEKKAMRAASRLVRGAQRSIDRINGRLNNSINGVDIPGVLMQGRSMGWRVYPPYDGDARRP